MISKRLLILFFLFLIICLFFKEQIFTGATFGYSHISIDTEHLYTYGPPFMHQAQQKGIFLWDPYLSFGIPLLADAYIATYYPLYLFCYILPYEVTFKITPLLHMLLGGFLLYLLARKIKISGFSSLISAVIFMLCGYNIILVLSHDTAAHSAIALMPALFLAIYGIFEKPTLLRGVFLALVVGLGISTRGFSYNVIVFAAAAAFSAFLLLTEYKEAKDFKKILPPLLIIVIFFILGFLLNAVILLPLKELIGNSVLREGFGDEYRHKYTPLSLINIIFYSLVPIYEGRYPETQGAFTVYNLFYLGVFPFALYFLSFFSKNKLKNFFCIVLPLVSLFFACGYYNPFFRFVEFVPLLKNMRLVYRFYSLFVFAVSVCSGLGLDFLMKQGASEYTKKKNIFIKICLAGNVLVALVYFKDRFESFLGGFAGFILRMKTFIGPQVLLVFILLLITALLICLMRKKIKKGCPPLVFWLIPVLILCFYELRRIYSGSVNFLALVPFVIPKPMLAFSLISALTLLALYFKKKASHRLLQVLVLFLVIMNFYAFYRSGKPIEKEINLKNETYSEFFKDKRNIYRVLILGGKEYPYRRVVHPHTGILYQTPVFGGPNYVFLIRYAKFMNLVSGGYFKFDNGQANSWDLLLPYEAGDFINGGNIHLINMANVKYLVSESFIPEITISKENFASPFNLVVDKDIKIFENKDALARAYIVHSVRVIKEEGKILKELGDPKFNYRDYVILEDGAWRGETGKVHAIDGQAYDIAGREKAGTQEQALQESEYAKISEYNMDSLAIEANMLKDGFLVLSEIYYPGWRVFIDGKQGQVYQANYLFRGVFLEKGKHKVQFIYKPVSRQIGLIVSIVSLILLSAIFFYCIYRNFKISHAKNLNKTAVK